VAHTIVINSSSEKKVTGRKADVVLAAHFASQAALRLLKPGTEVRLRILIFYSFVTKKFLRQSLLLRNLRSVVLMLTTTEIMNKF